MTEVLIHQYYKNLTAIEFEVSDTTPENFLVFVGGLCDGFLTVPYIKELASATQKDFGSKWALVQALISSSYHGYGTGSLKRDAEELAKLVEYLRTKRGNSSSKVILMGHSTGCQDTMEYLTKYTTTENFKPIQRLDGGILQAPVSDSEAITDSKKAAPLIKLAKNYIDQGRPNELLPVEALEFFFGSPFSAYRFHSLASQHGDDDYFSSYLTSENNLKTFGQIKCPLLVLYSEKDEFVPESVDKDTLIEQWKSTTQPGIWSTHSGIIKGATHNVGSKSIAGAVEDVISRVLAFIKDLNI